jgi:gliding motility-associated-like protein
MALSTLWCAAGLNAQDIQRCGTDELHEERMNDIMFAVQFAAKVNAVDRFLKDRGQQRMPVCDEVLLIPVAVHFQNTGLGLACATDMALDQVERINLDFAGTNTDIETWNTDQASTFPGIQNGESCIQFCLATLSHPAGFGLMDGEYAVTIDQTTGDNDAAWTGYLNFFVRDLGAGLLGFSPLGGNGNGDGATCNVNAFSSISCVGNTINASFNLGRTMVHEIGHYFLLEHPWGGGGCASTDDIADTPITSNSTFGCPALGLVTCTAPVLWMSYMDYCDDDCPFTVYVPNAITCNADGINERLVVVPSCPYSDYKLSIFDRWGNIVFETIDTTKKWNGGEGNYYVNKSLYFYKVSLRWGSANSANVEEFTGSVSVIR